MKAILLMPALFQVGFALSAQLPNAKTETLRIAGNCSLCETAIETAASKNNEASITWDKDSRLAELTYDSVATNADEILKRVAYAGYDNERYLAPPEAYASLEACCRYERAPEATATVHAIGKPDTGAAHEGHTKHEAYTKHEGRQGQVISIDGVLDAYFKLKDVLVEGKADAIPSSATALAKRLEGLSMPNAKKAASEASEVAKARDIEGQRAAFSALSESLFALAKANPPSKPIYYQHCPMYTHGKAKGAHWLSAEKAIRNPYYGDRMLTCGNVVETLGGESKTKKHKHD